MAYGVARLEGRLEERDASEREGGRERVFAESTPPGHEREGAGEGVRGREVGTQLDPRSNASFFEAREEGRHVTVGTLFLFVPPFPSLPFPFYVGAPSTAAWRTVLLLLCRAATKRNTESSATERETQTQRRLRMPEMGDDRTLLGVRSRTQARHKRKQRCSSKDSAKSKQSRKGREIAGAARLNLGAEKRRGRTGEPRLRIATRTWTRGSTWTCSELTEMTRR
eukprot:3048421-Rhodomonas_salina.2